jgi:hypothetical protein
MCWLTVLAATHGDPKFRQGHIVARSVGKMGSQRDTNCPTLYSSLEPNDDLDVLIITSQGYIA